MNKQIKKFDVLQTSKVVAVLYGVFSLLHFTIGLGMLIFGSSQAKAGGIFFVLTPIFMIVAGFIFTAIMAAVYNLLAAKIGGIEFELVDVEKKTL